MTTTKNTETAELTDDTVLDPEVARDVTLTEATAPHELTTSWANQGADRIGFDDDQVLVDNWAQTDPESALELLATAMTLADAEEFIATCYDVATEHEARARRARDVAQRTAARLGKTAAEATKELTTPTPAPVPTTKLPTIDPAILKSTLGAK